jgi:hypothetical protein
MKKLAILFLLTSLLALPAFAIEGVGDFVGYLRIDGGDVGNDARTLTIKPGIEFSRDLIENLSLFVGVGLPISTPLKDIKFGVAMDSLELKISYGGIAAGPGNLGFFFYDYLKVGDFEKAGDTLEDGITIGATYGGLVAGPGALGFELGAELGVIAAGDVDFVFKDVYLAATYALDLGVSITLKPFLAIDPDVGFGGLYLKVGYATEVFGAGIEIDKFNDEFKGFPVDLYGEAYLLGGPLTVGAHLKFGNINGTGDITINPGIYAKYAF